MSLKINSYVRCPVDLEYVNNPRIFVCGRLLSVDQDQGTASVQIYDPYATLAYFEDLPSGENEFPLRYIQSCQLFKNSHVIYNLQDHVVLSVEMTEDEF